MNVPSAHRRRLPAGWLLLAMAAGSASAGPVAKRETRVAPSWPCSATTISRTARPARATRFRPTRCARTSAAQGRGLAIPLSRRRGRARRPAGFASAARDRPHLSMTAIRSFTEKALPILRSENVRATLFVVSGWVDHRRPACRRLLGWAEIRDLERTGLVEIAAHTHVSITTWLAIRPATPRPPPPPVATCRKHRATRIATSTAVASWPTWIRRARACAPIGPDVHALAWPYGEWNETARSRRAPPGFDVTLDWRARTRRSIPS